MTKTLLTRYTSILDFSGTINHFILDTRMKRARDLILETNLQLGEISSRLGYANQNYFTKTFTRYFGVNPSIYRNQAL